MFILATLVGAVTLLSCSVDASPVRRQQQCHCVPGESCWPDANAWAALNTSACGGLVQVTPLGAPCHVPFYDESACAELQTYKNSSQFLSQYPGALQWENWSGWPEQNQSCYTEGNVSIPCQLGRISPYSVTINQASDAQAAIAFATQYNIKLVIKNTGHEYLGRSSAPNSLQLNTYNLKSMELLNGWVPTNATYTAVPEPLAVRLGSGVQLHTLYQWAGQNGVIVTGGTSDTVGASGGYFQGGGHSLMGALTGMSADNVLEVTIILASGEIVVANDYQYQDLFFAVRGGAGGTWGVVMEVVSRAFPDPPVIYHVMNFTFASATDDFWEAAGATLENVGPSIVENTGSGYWYLYPEFTTSTTSKETVAALEVYTYFINQTNITAVEEYMAPMVLAAQNATQGALRPAGEPWVTLIPKMTDVYMNELPGVSIVKGDDDDDKFYALGSRLMSRDFINSEGVGAKIAQAAKAMDLGLDGELMGFQTSGKEVWAKAGVDNAVNAMWRQASTHMIIGRLWNANLTFAEQTEVYEAITNNDVPILADLFPGTPYCYLSEADSHQPNFQEIFWGGHYQRLQTVKAKYDPNDLFIVRLGVGSENWDDDGHCRITPS